ncbi:hypothetical protein E0500_010775 [Streptomyces sp. KM273126]|uniref:hypothetical protein n=1 Tax=Streptomyces sp. KM273126 TaxID=2545247 RepID=UPI00103C7821|nr:hypothetical protein [Streptomyces sp. KM273126]MBA2807881.1 hypothetical protein [Streptomyces sp. KM273126]
MRRLGTLTVAFAAGTLLLTGGLTACTSAPPPSRPAADDVIKAATRHLIDACLRRQGLTPPQPGSRPAPAADQQRVSDALFGAGRTELSVRLPTGYVVRGHTDGCLAAAQQRLYGDQRRWFRTSAIVNNLRPEAAHTHSTLAEVRHRHRAELADWRRLRARALKSAKTVLATGTDPSPKGTTHA